MLRRRSVGRSACCCSARTFLRRALDTRTLVPFAVAYAFSDLTTGRATTRSSSRRHRSPSGFYPYFRVDVARGPRLSFRILRTGSNDRATSLEMRVRRSLVCRVREVNHTKRTTILRYVLNTPPSCHHVRFDVFESTSSKIRVYDFRTAFIRQTISTAFYARTT